MRYVGVIVMCCAMALSACGPKPRPYERHVETAFDDKGMRRIGYATLNLDYLDALLKDLDACYADAK